MGHLYGGLYKVLNGGTMRRFLAILGLLAILALIPATRAQESLLLVESNSYVSIGENSAHEKVVLRYVVPQNPENALQDNFRVYGTLSGVNVYDSGGELHSSVEDIENGWSLITYSLRGTLRAGDRSDVTVEFTKAVENIGGNRVYAVRYKWSMTPTSYQVIVKLPKGSSLIGTSENTSELYVENDSMYMRYSGVLRNSFQTYVVFKSQPSEGQLPGGEPQAGEDQMLLYAILIVAVAAVPLVIFVFRKTRAIKPPVKVPRRVPKVVPRVDVKKILRMLHGNERGVVKTLIQKDNLTQTELCGRTGIPRATMSRILQGLENKGVVRRVEHGMSKKVMLAGWVRKWEKKE